MYRVRWLSSLYSPRVWMLAALLVVAAYLRTVTFTQSLWYDEILTARVSEAPWSEFIQRMLVGNQSRPPLYYVAAHVVVGLFPRDWANRIPALIFSLAMIPLFWLFARRVLDDPAALLATFFLAISPMDATNAQDAREYSLLAFASLLALYGFWRGFHDDKGWQPDKGLQPLVYWLLFSIGTALSIAASFFGFLALLGLGILFVPLWTGRLVRERPGLRDAAKPVGYFAGFTLLSLAAFSPCIPFLLRFLEGEGALSGQKVVQVAFSFNTQFFWRLAVDFGWGAGRGFWLWCGALLLGVAWAIRFRPSLVVLALAQLTGGLLPFLVVYGRTQVQVFWPRYIIFVLPALLLLAAAGATALISLCISGLPRVRSATVLKRRFAASIVAGGIGLWGAWPAMQSLFAATKENYRDICAFIERHQQPGDVVLSHLCGDRYILGYYAKDLPPSLETTGDFITVKGLETACAQHSRIWFIGRWWGAIPPKIDEAMMQKGFMVLAEPWMRGLYLKVWDQNANDANRAALLLQWLTIAYNELPYHPMREVNLAMAYGLAGQTGEADRHLRHALEAYARYLPDDPNSRLGMAEVYRMLGDKEGMCAAYRGALRLNPWSVRAWKGLAPLEAEAGRVKPALRAYQCYIRLDPQFDDRVLLDIAELYEQDGNIDAAFESLKKLSRRIEASKGAPPFYWAVGARVLARRGQLDRAIREFQAIIEQAPQYGTAYGFYADALIEAGRLSEAQEIIGAGLTRDPQNEKLIALRRSFQTMMGLPSDAPGAPMTPAPAPQSSPS